MFFLVDVHRCTIKKLLQSILLAIINDVFWVEILQYITEFISTQTLISDFFNSFASKAMRNLWRLNIRNIRTI